MPQLLMSKRHGLVAASARDSVALFTLALLFGSVAEIISFFVCSFVRSFVCLFVRSFVCSLLRCFFVCLRRAFLSFFVLLASFAFLC